MQRPPLCLRRFDTAAYSNCWLDTNLLVRTRWQRGTNFTAPPTARAGCSCANKQVPHFARLRTTFSAFGAGRVMFFNSTQCPDKTFVR